MAKQTIVVMSDSHGDRSIVEAIKEKYLGSVDAIFHNGDSELKSDDPVWEDIHVVRGNMDFYDGYPERLVTQLGPTRIIQTHGHLFQINFNFQKLDLWAQEEEADICLYGHLRSRCLERRSDPLCESWFDQSATWSYSRVPLC